MQAQKPRTLNMQQEPVASAYDTEEVGNLAKG